MCPFLPAKHQSVMLIRGCIFPFYLSFWSLNTSTEPTHSSKDGWLPGLPQRYGALYEALSQHRAGASSPKVCY